MSFLASDAFQKLWVEINRRAHKQLVKVLTGKGGKLVQTKNGQVVVNLAPALARIEQRLHDRGIDIFDKIPPSAIPSNFVILDSKQLKQGQRGVRLLKTLAIALPLLVLALLAAAIALSERRRRTLLQASLGIAASMAVLGVLLTIGRSIYLDQIVRAEPAARRRLGVLRRPRPLPPPRSADRGRESRWSWRRWPT